MYAFIFQADLQVKTEVFQCADLAQLGETVFPMLHRLGLFVSFDILLLIKMSVPLCSCLYGFLSHRCICVYYVHTHTYIYIYIYTYTHTHIYNYIYIYTHTHTYIYIYIHMYIYIHTHTHTYIYIYVYVCVCVFLLVA